MSAALRTLFDLVEETWSVEDDEELGACAREIESRRTGSSDMTDESALEDMFELVSSDPEIGENTRQSRVGALTLRRQPDRVFYRLGRDVIDVSTFVVPPAGPGRAERTGP